MRYEIQYRDLQEFLKGEGNWVRFYSARTRFTLKGARKEWWKWANRQWDDQPLFRIYDNKEKKVVEQ